MEIPDAVFRLSQDIPDSGTHAVEGNRCAESVGMPVVAYSTSPSSAACLESVGKSGTYGFAVIARASTTWARTPAPAPVLSVRLIVVAVLLRTQQLRA